jgi:hypothetical protein
MSAEASSGINGKAPVNHRPEGLVNVQPPRLSDLQPKYASVIEHDESNPEAHGWYASFSKLYSWKPNKGPSIDSIFYFRAFHW